MDTEQQMAAGAAAEQAAIPVAPPDNPQLVAILDQPVEAITALLLGLSQPELAGLHWMEVQSQGRLELLSAIDVAIDALPDAASEEALRNVREAGREARVSGLGEDGNPYAVGALRDSWSHGWTTYDR